MSMADVAQSKLAADKPQRPSGNASRFAGAVGIVMLVSTPLTWLLTGDFGPLVIGKLVEKGDLEWGYDAQTDQYVNMYKAGIIDPVKVVRTALQDAASVAGLIITTEAAVAERPKTESAGGSGGMSGGMGDMDY